MGPTSDASAASAVCRGLVRVRQQQQLGGSSSRRGTNSAVLLDTHDASRLDDDEWYFCVLQTQPRLAIQWFSLIGDNGAEDDTDVYSSGDVIVSSAPAHARRDSVLLASTVISHFEAVDDAVDDCDDSAAQDLRGSVLEFNGVKLEAEACTFYMEDHVHGVRRSLDFYRVCLCMRGSYVVCALVLVRL